MISDTGNRSGRVPHLVQTFLRHRVEGLIYVADHHQRVILPQLPPGTPLVLANCFDGPGIPAEELPHVFDRFWRSPSARALPGSGLGLSIVARTVEQAGGEITLARAEGGGTVATVRLPGAPMPPPEGP